MLLRCPTRFLLLTLISSLTSMHPWVLNSGPVPVALSFSWVLNSGFFGNFLVLRQNPTQWFITVCRILTLFFPCRMNWLVGKISVSLGVIAHWRWVWVSRDSISKLLNLRKKLQLDLSDLLSREMFLAFFKAVFFFLSNACDLDHICFLCFIDIYPMQGPPAEGEMVDQPHSNRFNAVIEKIERLYMVSFPISLSPFLFIV